MLCSVSVCLEPAASIIVEHLRSVAFSFSSYHGSRRCGEWICEFADIDKTARVELTAKWQRSDNEQDRYIAEPLLRQSVPSICSAALRKGCSGTECIDMASLN
jgi:hypothetical protein